MIALVTFRVPMSRTAMFACIGNLSSELVIGLSYVSIDTELNIENLVCPLRKNAEGWF